jgi:hypothetical protein
MSVEAIRQLMNRGTAVSTQHAVRSAGLLQADSGLRAIASSRSAQTDDLVASIPAAGSAEPFSAVLGQMLDQTGATGAVSLPEGGSAESIPLSSASLSAHAAFLQALAPAPLIHADAELESVVPSDLTAEAPDSVETGLWEIQQAIPVQPSTPLVEQPGLMAATGNADADELVSHVISLRMGRGLPADASSRDVSSAQAILVSLGHDVGAYGPYANGVDGILGPKTSEALRRFQAGQGISETGTLTAETALRLLQQGKPSLDRVSSDWQQMLSESPFAADAHQGTANPYWYVRFVAQAGDDPDTMGNIDAVFKGRLAALARDAGQQAAFGEGFRTLERQAWFYQRYLDGDGALAAKPGQSRHNMGLAVDTQSAWLQQVDEGKAVSAQVTLLRYGLCKPMADGQGRGREPWHLEPVETRNG